LTVTPFACASHEVVTPDKCGCHVQGMGVRAKVYYSHNTLRAPLENPPRGGDLRNDLPEQTRKCGRCLQALKNTATVRRRGSRRMSDRLSSPERCSSGNDPRGPDKFPYPVASVASSTGNLSPSLPIYS